MNAVPIRPSMSSSGLGLKALPTRNIRPPQQTLARVTPPRQSSTHRDIMPAKSNPSPKAASNRLLPSKPASKSPKLSTRPSPQLTVQLKNPPKLSTTPGLPPRAPRLSPRPVLNSARSSRTVPTPSPGLGRKYPLFSPRSTGRLDRPSQPSPIPPVKLSTNTPRKERLSASSKDRPRSEEKEELSRGGERCPVPSKCPPPPSHSHAQRVVTPLIEFIPIKATMLGSDSRNRLQLGREKSRPSDSTFKVVLHKQ
jgi:hypothetical protein